MAAGPIAERNQGNFNLNYYCLQLIKIQQILFHHNRILSKIKLISILIVSHVLSTKIIKADIIYSGLPYTRSAKDKS